VALIAALGSLVVFRDDGREHGEPRRNAEIPDPGLVVSGPPAFAAPAVTANRIVVDTPDAPPRFPAGQPRPTTTVPKAPTTTTTISFFAETPPPFRDRLPNTASTTAAPPKPVYRVTSTGCRRGATSITYTGTIVNDGAEPARFSVSVRIDDGKGTVLGTTTVVTKPMQPATSFALRADFSGSKVRNAASCDVTSVEVLPPA
jgi:hypothetical protein